VYSYLRGLASPSVDIAEANARLLIDIEKVSGLFWERELQQAVLSHAWLVDLTDRFYELGHIQVTCAVLIALWIFQREAYRRARLALLFSMAIGLVFFYLFPVAPPRLMPEMGYVDTIGGTAGYRTGILPFRFTNDYAAVPSLHAGWTLLHAIILASLIPDWRFRWLPFLFPLLMAYAVVATARHWVIDIFFGWAVVVAALLLADQARARFARRRAATGPARSPSL
jgi:membrane-associated phospholipid phosphatase